MRHFEEILAYIRTLRVISSHNHHLPDEQHEDMSLKKLLSGCYVNWAGPLPDLFDKGAVEKWILKYKANTFFRWVFKAVEELYGFEFKPENMRAIDRAVAEAYGDKSYHLRLLSDRCRFDRVVNERQPRPGYDLGHPELFSPSFRCDGFFSGYDRDKPEPNGLLIRTMFARPEVDGLGDYLAQMEEIIERKRAEGCVALKVAIAYERQIEFKTPDLEKAARALDNKNATEEEITAFGDAVMFKIAETAAKAGLPLQIHTGLGQCGGTNPIRLLKLIEANPETVFHLLHGGYPWLDDTFALLINFKNVYSDICWIPYLSTSAAVRYIVEGLESADAHRFTWGCDTWYADDSVGALLAMEHALSKALAAMVEDGAFDVEYAKYAAKRIMRDNAAELFKL